MAKAVKTALIGNLIITVIKTFAAIITHSASMAAEAVHSLADSGNQLLLMFGMKQSKKAADVLHPFGHGKEEYFWSFIVAMMLFILGSVYSIYEGIHKIMNPEAISFPWLVIGILFVSFGIEFWSWWTARQELDCTTKELLEEVIESKDSNTVVVFVEDTGALLGLGIAFIGSLLSWVTGNSIYDAVASIIIGNLLFIMAGFLANEMRKLMIGEAVDLVTQRYLRRVVSTHPDVTKVGKIRTMQLGNNSCIVAVDADFRNSLHDWELESIMIELKKKIRAAIPEAEYIFIQLQKL